MKKIIFKIMACPDCKIGVSYDDKDRQFECSSCKKKFNVSGDTPVFFSEYSSGVENSGEFFYEKKDVSAKASLMKKTFRKLSNIADISIIETLHDRLKQKYIVNSSADSLILNLGSGIDNILMKDNVVNFDIFPHPNTDVSGDGHYLPFLSDSFDGVWLCAVLEHLDDPFRVSSEVYRVLKPGGFVLVGAPFMYHLHGSPHDYFRYTDSGLRSVFRDFKEVECGRTHTYPTGTVIEVLAQYFSIFTDNKKFASLLRLIVKIFLWPFRFLDLYLKKKNKAQILSGGFVFLGKKGIK